MWTNQIEDVLSKDVATRPVFGGVYPGDKLPARLHPGKRLYIANTDPAHKPGQHWVAFYFDPSGICSYFDSYGLPPLRQSFVTFIERNACEWIYNNKRLQHARSNLCGHYCLFFAVHICRGDSMSKIVQQFDTDVKFNVILVEDFINHYYDTKVVPASSSFNQCCRCAMSTFDSFDFI